MNETTPPPSSQRVTELMEYFDENDIAVMVEELRKLGYRITPPVMSEGTNAVE